MFEWDETKRGANIDKHGIDFVDAVRLWDGPVFERNSRRLGLTEDRRVAIGIVHGRVIAVIYTWRGRARRIISARRARRDEEAAYYARFGRTGEAIEEQD